ncbi:uncharacterized protein FA14DRAFT_51243 [Meira miltonrushii]|uniref:Uncharacterized protein n=1 Tax=Meira miltonrushii TaxID=1280837 RepID=A0A316VEU4_9BASI|nr:uncharacterized protein FA14DRAFT_51243 [Meira miltonrushii]PWN36046.1 hypothetical protein FA14DRAFT_51243 [Meira miltonrushii]
MKRSCEPNDTHRQRTQSLGCPVGYQNEGRKSLILQSSYRAGQRGITGDQIRLRKSASFYTPETKISQIVVPKRSSPSWMTPKEREVPIIIVSCEDPPANPVQKIRKHRSMPQLIHGPDNSSQDSLFSQEERMRIKSTILDIPDILRNDRSSAFYENRAESVEQIPDNTNSPSQEEFQASITNEDDSTAASDLLKDLSEANLLEPNYTEDDEDQAMLIVAQKKRITSSNTVSQSTKPRIVFNDELSKWREQGRITPECTSDREKGSVETEILSSENDEKEIKSKSKSFSVDQPYMRSITEDTSDEIYERLRPLSDSVQKDWTSSDHWKRLNNKRKVELSQAMGGDSQDSRVEVLMTPEPCDVQHGKESPSFPKRFSDDPSRRTMLSSVKNPKESPFKGTPQEKRKRPPKKKIPSIDIPPVEISKKEHDTSSNDGWKRSPLTPKSSQFFTEVNPDNNLRDALAAWEVLQKQYRKGNANNQAARRRSMTESDVNVRRNLPNLEDIYHAEKKSNNNIVHLDKSLTLDSNNSDEQPQKRSSMSRGRQWLINRMRQNDLIKQRNKANAAKEAKSRIPEQTSEILASSWVRQSLMEYDTIGDHDDIVQAPIQIEPASSHAFTQEARRIYLQLQAREEQRRKKELENLGMLIAWGKISVDDQNEREGMFEENRQTRDLSGLFGHEQKSQDSSKSQRKLIRKTASDNGTLHHRIVADAPQSEPSPSKTADAKSKPPLKSQFSANPTQKVSKKNSSNALKDPPPLPKKPSSQKLKKDADSSTSYTPPVTNDILPGSQSSIGHPINSLVNESLSDKPRSIVPDDKANNEANHELELDAFLIEVDRTFRTTDTMKNFRKTTNFTSSIPPPPPPPNNENVNETSQKQQNNSKSNRRNSLSHLFKWKLIKSDDQQNAQAKGSNQPNESTASQSQRHLNASTKLHQRSKSNLIQLFARHKVENAT